MKIKNVLKIVRLPNLVMIFFMHLLMAWNFFDAPSAYNIFSDVYFYLFSVSTLLIGAAGNVINDYYDIKIDTINKPQDVLIGKHFSRRQAIFWHTVLNFTGIGIGFFINWKLGVVNFIAAFLLWLYSNLLKRLPFIGNFIIAFLTALSVLSINVFYEEHNIYIYVYAFFAFQITIIREIVKDMEDIRGDLAHGCKTLPIVWGIRQTKKLIYPLIWTFPVFLLGLILYSKSYELFYYESVFVVVLGFLHYKVYYADKKRKFYFLSQFIKVIMLSGIISCLFI